MPAGLQSHPGNARFATTLPRDLGHGSRMQNARRRSCQNLVAGPDPTSGRMPKGLQRPKKRSGEAANLSTPARLRDGSHNLFSLVALTLEHPRRMPCGTPVNLEVAGSSPALSSPARERPVAQSGRALETCRQALVAGVFWKVAQLVEQRVLVPQVEGSNPSLPAIFPGECRAGDRMPSVTRNSLPRTTQTRRMPCGTPDL